jgi:hypothetical protein
MNLLQTLKSGIGYVWAAACLAVILTTFVGLNFWTKSLADGTGLHISARYSGGEIRQTVDHGSYRTLLHRIVFDGLVGERSRGFVQLDWVPREKETLPAIMEEDLDIDGDGSAEIGVRIDTVAGKAELQHRTHWVLGLEPLITSGSERILRVQLRNPHR